MLTRGYVASNGPAGGSSSTGTWIVGVALLGTQDGSNRVFTTPSYFLHDPSMGITIELFHNGRRLMQTLSGDVRYGEYVVSESSGVGTGWDTITFLTFAPALSPRSTVVSNFFKAP